MPARIRLSKTFIFSGQNTELKRKGQSVVAAWYKALKEPELLFLQFVVNWVYHLCNVPSFNKNKNLQLNKWIILMLELFSNCHNLVKLSGEIIELVSLYIIFIVPQLIFHFFYRLKSVFFYKGPIPQLFESLIQRVLTWKITEQQNISFSNFNCFISTK